MPLDESADPRGRRYPVRPIVGVGAVVVTDERLVVLVRRRHDPLAGRWSLPGGALDVGERLVDGVRREVLEETGLVVAVGVLVEIFDHVVRDDAGRVEYHFVIADYVCRPEGGVLVAGTDVDAVALADPATLHVFNLTDKAHAVICRGLELCGIPPTSGP